MAIPLDTVLFQGKRRVQTNLLKQKALCGDSHLVVIESVGRGIGKFQKEKTAPKVNELATNSYMLKSQSSLAGEMEASRYTLNCNLKYNTSDAIDYLYFNGNMPKNASQSLYLKWTRKTTICEHLRLLYGMSWHEDKEVFNIILYCLTDSKAIVGRLIEEKMKSASEPQSNIGINAKSIYMQQSKSYPTSNVSFKPKKIKADDLLATKIQLNEKNIPQIYLFYKTLHKIFESWNHHKQREELLLTTLECAYLRTRLDRRMIEIEMIGKG